MAITSVTLKFKATKTGGAQVFSGTGELTGTGADKAAAESSIANQIQALVDAAQQTAGDLVDAQSVFNAS